MTDQNIERDLENILERVARAQNIKNFEVFPNSTGTKGEGFLSEFFTGEVLDKDRNERTKIAIKKAPSGGFSAHFGSETIYKNEIHFYSVIFPELDKFQKGKRVKHPFNYVPRYLTGLIDPQLTFVAMENLKTNGYVLHNKKNFLNKEHLEFIFNVYGKWHALSFTYKQEHPEKFEEITNPLINISEEFGKNDGMMAIMEDSFQTIMNTFDPISEADVLEKLKKIESVRESFKKLHPYKGKYKCIIHGDCWSNNMLFKYKESGNLENMKLIDFQLPYSSNPIFDLSYFFYSGASKEDMDKLDYYLDLYYQSFSDFAVELGGNPNEMFPLAALKEEWKYYGLWGVFLGFQLWLVKLMDQEEILELIEHENLPKEEYFKIWSERMVKVREGETYQERTRNICIHAVDYGII